MAFPVEIGAAIAVLLMAAAAMESDGRELRPSDHGLVYQESPPPGVKSPAEKSFFVGGGGGGGGESSPPDAALPRAMNSSDTSWWNGIVARDRGRKDHVRDVLLLGSLVCGITGVALLVAAGFVYFFRYQKHESLSTSPSS